MDCQSFKNQIFAYAEGSLSLREATLFDDHASGCESCTGLLARLRKVLQVIEEEKATEPDPFAETRILARLESAMEKQQRPGLSLSRYLQPAAMALAVLVALFIGITVGLAVENRFSGNQDNPEQFQSIRQDLNVPENGNNDFVLFDN